MRSRCPERVTPMGRSRLRSLRIQLRERLARDPKRVDGGWDARVNRDLQESLHDLLALEPVAHGALHVELELLRPIESADHREVDEAAIAPAETLATPHRPPAVLGDQLLQRAREGIRAGDGAIHILAAEHRFADGETTLVEILVVHR